MIKRITAFILVLTLAVSMAITAAAEVAQTESQNLRADANRDGIVNIFDVTRIQRYLAELVGEEDIDLIAADADEDGEVSIRDATRIQRYLAGLCDMNGFVYDEYEGIPV